MNIYVKINDITFLLLKFVYEFIQNIFKNFRRIGKKII